MVYVTSEVARVQIINNILFDESLKTKKRDKILKSLTKQDAIKGILFVVRVNIGPNILEIVSSKELYRLDSMGKPVAIVAVVKDQDGAFKLIEEWMDQLVQKYNRIYSSDFDKEFDINW